MTARERIDVEVVSRMRDEGCTMQQCADVFGVSRQAVQQCLDRHHRTRRTYASLIDAIPYEGLRRFMLANPRLKPSGLSMILFGVQGKKEHGKTRRLLEGKDVLLTVHAVQNLTAASGMSFEELFRRRDNG